MTQEDDRREKRRAYQREYNARNREKRQAYMREYVARNREKIRAYNREYYGRNPERTQARYRANREELLAYAQGRRKIYHRRLKKQVFTAYGSSCACCGEGNPAFLSIDHVNGGGRAHRKAVGGGVAILLDIIKRRFPADFQLLCYNCNLGRAFNGGTCPHKDVDNSHAA